jgi:hypothetical protein
MTHSLPLRADSESPAADQHAAVAALQRTVTDLEALGSRSSNNRQLSGCR